MSVKLQSTLTFLLLLHSFVSYSQKGTVKVEICAECAISETMTKADARECAMKKAEEDALIKAGISKRVGSVSILHMSEQGYNFAENFQSVSQSEFRGAVVNRRILSEISYQDDLGDFIIELCAEFEVMEHGSDPDPSFMLEIGGLMPAYPNPSHLQFYAEGSAGYLYAFLVEGNAVYSFYPNEKEPDKFLEKGEQYVFPNPISQQHYLLSNDDPEAAKMLFFLYSKSPLYFPATWNFEELINWIYRIEPSERYIILHPFGMN
jgi:hypothetical protein